MWLPCFEYIWPSNGMKMLKYSTCSLLLFLFRTNSIKGHLDENDVRYCYGNFFQKWHSESWLITAMFKVPVQQITRHIENRILKDTLQLINLRIWININSNTAQKKLRQTSWNKNWWKCLEKDQLHKNPSVYFEEHCT